MSRSKVRKDNEGKTWYLIGECKNPEMYAIKIVKTGTVKYIRKCNYGQNESFRSPFITTYNSE